MHPVGSQGPQAALHLLQGSSLVGVALETPQPSPQEAGTVDVWRIPEAGAAHSELTPESGAEEPFLSHASSLLSLHVDLGPSILDDVLQIMDQDLGHLQIPT